MIGISSNKSYNSTTFRDVRLDALERVRQQTNYAKQGHTYGYDGLGRLASDSTVTLGTGCSYSPDYGTECNVVTVSTFQDFVYDSAGNRKPGTYGAGNRIQSFGCSYATNPDGTVKSRTSCPAGIKNLDSLTWRAEGSFPSRIKVGGSNVEYFADPAGRLARKDVGGVTRRYYLWNGDELYAELDSVGNTVAEYSWYPGLDQPHQLKVGSTVYNVHRDAGGNVIALTDTAFNVGKSYEYGPWGDSTGTWTTNVALSGDNDRARWKGALWMGPEVDLYYMRNRWYEPATGRFLSEDPAGLEAGINPYAFAENDPVNNADPTGLQSRTICYTDYTGTRNDPTKFGSKTTCYDIHVPEPDPFMVHGISLADVQAFQQAVAAAQARRGAPTAGQVCRAAIVTAALSAGQLGLAAMGAGWAPRAVRGVLRASAHNPFYTIRGSHTRIRRQAMIIGGFATGFFTDPLLNAYQGEEPFTSRDLVENLAGLWAPSQAIVFVLDVGKAIQRC